MKIVCKNKRAYHDYTILKKYEAGLSLKGSEVKSLRDGKVNLKGSFCKIENNELFVHSMHISVYPQAGPYNNHEPLRVKKLLLHKYEIQQILKAIEQKGLTIVPLQVYFSKRNAKIEIGVARGKRKYDKRESIKRRQADREIQRAKKNYR